MQTMNRDETMLINNLSKLKGVRHLQRVLLVWNNQNQGPSNLKLPDIGVPIMVNYLNSLFRSTL